MSYCRWSCLDCTCDVYAYESDEGYQIHLSSKRLMGPQPYVPYQEMMDNQVTSEELFAAYKVYMEALHSSEYVDNNLPYGAWSFSCSDLTEFYHMMLELKGLGYLFPDYVLTTILGELNDEGESIDES